MPTDVISSVAFSVAAGLLAPVLGAPVAWLLGNRKRRRLRALCCALREIRAQRRNLQVRRLQLMVPDAYGGWADAGWTQEKAYFCKNRILPRLAAAGVADRWPGIARIVERRLERASTNLAPRRLSSAMNPAAYERYCALLLRQAGWRARVTQVGADQGADVLAIRGRRSLVLQCKLHSRPVGNKAVQQVAAARAHHRADLAAVVSNTDYTAPARQLAASNGVFLLHHEQLRGFGRSRP